MNDGFDEILRTLGSTVLTTKQYVEWSDLIKKRCEIKARLSEIDSNIVDLLYRVYTKREASYENNI